MVLTNRDGNDNHCTIHVLIACVVAMFQGDWKGGAHFSKDRNVLLLWGVSMSYCGCDPLYKVSGVQISNKEPQIGQRCAADNKWLYSMTCWHCLILEFSYDMQAFLGAVVVYIYWQFQVGESWRFLPRIYGKQSGNPGKSLPCCPSSPEVPWLFTFIVSAFFSLLLCYVQVFSSKGQFLNYYYCWFVFQ